MPATKYSKLKGYACFVPLYLALRAVCHCLARNKHDYLNFMRALSRHPIPEFKRADEPLDQDWWD